MYLSKADRQRVNIIKHVKGGLNPNSTHQLQLHGQHVGQAAKISLISVVITVTEAIAVGRSFASIKGYHLDGNKEMLAMGCMNIAGSLKFMLCGNWFFLKDFSEFQCRLSNNSIKYC